MTDNILNAIQRVGKEDIIAEDVPPRENPEYKMSFSAHREYNELHGRRAAQFWEIDKVALNRSLEFQKRLDIAMNILYPIKRKQNIVL